MIENLEDWSMLQYGRSNILSKKACQNLAMFQPSSNFYNALANLI